MSASRSFAVCGDTFSNGSKSSIPTIPVPYSCRNHDDDNLVISFIPADNMLQLNVTQVHQSLVNSGYTVPIEIIQHLMNKFHPPVAKRVTFDDYVHICILIQRITKFFSRFDREKSGIATVSYFEFITGVFDLCHFNASEDGGITSGVPPLPPKS